MRNEVELGTLCTLVTKGTTPTSVGMAFADSGVPFLRVQDLSERSICLDDVLYIDHKTHDSLGRSKITGGEFLITIAGTIGRTALVPDSFPESNCNQAIAILRFDHEELVPSYLEHWLATPQARQQISGRQVTATISNLSLGQIKEMKIPLPPPKTQKRIAAILDKADAIRRKRQQAIELADQFLRSVFLDLFGDPVTNPKGWDVSTFGEQFDVRDGTHDSPSYVSSGFPLVTSKNIKRGELDLSEVSLISEEDYNAINQRSKVDVGDVLMPMIGTIGNPVVIREEPAFAIKNVALIKPRDSHLAADFITALLNGPLLQQAIDQKSRGGTQKFLSLGDVRGLQCYLPDRHLVLQYLGIVKKLRKTISRQRQSDDMNLFESLSQKAFSGNL